MRPAISDLSQLPDHRLFEEIAVGIGLIIENAERLESIAQRLARMNEHRACGIVRSIAEEESAKVLILLDFVRCPRDAIQDRSRVLKSFYSHLAKRIYAEACRWSPSDFGDLKCYIEQERRDYYLDGPNDVDWILPNAAKTERESRMYVDYVQDITQEHGEHSWVSPVGGIERHDEHATPSCLAMARALHRVGFTTAKGLSVVAHVWRGFQPSRDTTSIELSRWRRRALDRAPEKGFHAELDADDLRATVYSWPFPLWPLNLTALRDPTPQQLRRQRHEELWRWEEIDAQRDPPPKVSPDKVLELSRTYADWAQERDHLMNKNRSGNFFTMSASLCDQLEELDSYRRLTDLLRSLTLEERMDLAALAWFGRHRRSGWISCHENARRTIGNDLSYECGLGAQWLTGMERWQSQPQAPATRGSGRKNA